MSNIPPAENIFTVRIGRRGTLMVQNGLREVWTNKRAKENQLLNHFSWLFRGMRATLRFPYCMNAKGEVEIKVLSWSFLYWVVIYCIMVAINAENLLALFNKILTEDMESDQAVQSAYNAVVLLYITVYPGSFAREFKGMALVINKWSDFEAAHLKGVGIPIKFKFRRANSLLQWVLIPAATLVILAIKNVLFWIHWYSLIPLIMIGIACLFMLNYWILGTFELCNISWNMKQKILLEFCSDRRVTAEEIRDLRLAWLELKVMIRRFAHSVSFIFTYLSLMMCSIFIMSAFINISFLSSGKVDFGLIVVMVITGGFLFVVNDCGHRLTSAAGKEICESLPRVNLNGMDPGAAEEVKLFMKVIRMNYPAVSFGGMIAANRSTVTSMISVTVTYLIVLLQFRSANVTPISIFLANSTSLSSVSRGVNSNNRSNPFTQ